MGRRAVWDFTVEDWSNYVCAGLVNANSGKTVCAVIEDVWWATGKHPFSKFHNIPKVGKMIIVSRTEEELADVLWQKMCRPGAFRIVEVNGKWFPVIPDKPEHKKREADWMLAPPLLSPSLWDGEPSWFLKKRGVPSMLKLKNGWQIVFKSGMSSPAKGGNWHLVHFDEEIEDERWYVEVAARGIMDYAGRFHWSATAQEATQAMYDLHDRCLDKSNKDAEEFNLNIFRNPHIANSEKAKFISKLSESEKKVRVEGLFAVLGLKVYPEFDEATHCVEPFPIPKHWTRYLGIDPGRSPAAALFWAVPPPDEPREGMPDYFHPNCIYQYAEVYQMESTPMAFARTVKDIAKDDSFESFIIDGKSAEQVTVGSIGQTVEKLYRDAFVSQKLRCHKSGNGFVYGSNRQKPREVDLRNLLEINESSQRPRLQVLAGKCDNFCREITRYHRKKTKERGITEDRVDKNNHTIDCAEYLASMIASMTSGYVNRGVISSIEPWWMQMEKQLAKMEQREGWLMGNSEGRVLVGFNRKGS